MTIKLKLEFNSFFFRMKHWFSRALQKCLVFLIVYGIKTDGVFFKELKVVHKTQNFLNCCLRRFNLKTLFKLARGNHSYHG